MLATCLERLSCCHDVSVRFAYTDSCSLYVTCTDNTQSLLVSGRHSLRGSGKYDHCSRLCSHPHHIFLGDLLLFIICFMRSITALWLFCIFCLYVRTCVCTHLGISVTFVYILVVSRFILVANWWATTPLLILTSRTFQPQGPNTLQVSIINNCFVAHQFTVGVSQRNYELLHYHCF